MKDQSLYDLLRMIPDGKRVGGDPQNEAGHFHTCTVCGQSVDRRRLEQVFHHEAPEHEPMERQ